MYANTNLVSVYRCPNSSDIKESPCYCMFRFAHTAFNMEMRRHYPVSRYSKKDINSNLNIKHKRTIETRKEEVIAIKKKFPTKVPIIVQRYSKESNLPQLDKSKFLVPQEITMSQFVVVIRNRMSLASTQALYLLVNNRSMLSMSATLAEAYEEHAAPDGFLYVTYASQEVFGGSRHSDLPEVPPEV